MTLAVAGWLARWRLLAGLAGWLGGWLGGGCWLGWLAGWLARWRLLAELARWVGSCCLLCWLMGDEEADGSCGWLAG